ncbi:hypothetical protein [Streptomyces mobaraensis]|uniref:hypothetical protein n=1 Tax=Streptomyces mobaraensis TaxID=35621 RepID=UPI0033DCF5EA
MAPITRGAAGRGEFRPRFDPAGLDDELRMVLPDLPAGRWLSMRTLLDRTVGARDWGRWASRTQVLGAAAAGTDVVRVWRAEEPDSVAATVMHARVAVERTVRAHRVGHPDAGRLWDEAVEACRIAAYASPDDPVPWICLLALAPLDEHQRLPEHRVPAPDPLLAPGPWNLLGEVERRDPGNREAYHRMTTLLATRADGSWGQAHQFVRWVLDRTPHGSPLLVLPLYVRVGLWRDRHGPGRELDMYWAGEYAVQDAERALWGWFDATGFGAAGRDAAGFDAAGFDAAGFDATGFGATGFGAEGPHAAGPDAVGSPDLSILDLSHLAHALWAAHRFTEAARVFAAMGPCAATRPWIHRADAHDRRPAEEVAAEWIIRARGQCEAAAEGPRR